MIKLFVARVRNVWCGAVLNSLIFHIQGCVALRVAHHERHTILIGHGRMMRQGVLQYCVVVG